MQPKEKCALASVIPTFMLILLLSNQQPLQGFVVAEEQTTSEIVRANDSNRSSDEQTATVSPSQQQQNPFYYADGRDESSDGSDLSFNLMNAPHERFQAVQRLLGSQQQPQKYNPRQDIQTSQPGEQSHEQDVPSGLQCTHKGRQFASGQVVPIEEQPCLNCTCRRAILQCYLRVCPPVISLEAKRKLQALSSSSSDGTGQRCRMVKEAHQCCPSLKCEPATQTIQTDSTVSIDLNSLPKGQMLSVTPLSTEASSLVLLRTNQESSTQQQQPSEQSSQHTNGQQQMVNNRSLDLDERQSLSSSNNQSSSQSNQNELDPNSLPKLTVINGAAGQRDSILLITSNPHSHSTDRHLTSAENSLASLPGQASKNSASQGGDLSSALMEALLEAVYSNGASRLAGLNLEGSCMINGSLYVEGSAVIPEGNALCHYCYCIRQKIMCVKPKCQLFISGCAPKYSNEYACCPTSYSCSANRDHFATDLTLTQRSGSLPPTNLGSSLEETNSLSARLWAAIESISRQIPSKLAPSLLYQPVRALEGAARMAHNESSSRPSTTTPTTTTSTSTEETAAKTQPTTTSTATTTSAPVTTPTTELPTTTRSVPDMKADMKTEEQPDVDSEPRSMTTSTVQPASSVSDFLEPMNRLGPLVVSPSAPSGCLENGRSYSIGEQIPTLESCKHCYCGLEGLKECKMIECQLQVGHMGCKPVIPEGHCCPVRYDCPSMSSSSPSGPMQPQSNWPVSASRYRSADPPADSQSSPVSSFPFADAIQCQSSSGLNDCKNSTTNSTFNSDTPIIESIRLQPPEQTQSRSTFNETITDELNKFIMQINGSPGQNSATQSNSLANSFDYSLLQSGIANDTNSRSQEMMISDQQSRMLNQDYHSVQAVPEDTPPQPTSEQQLPPGIFGIPSIQAEPLVPAVITPNPQLDSIVGVTTNQPTGSSVEYATNFERQVAANRDSRSTRAKFNALNEMLDEHKRHIFSDMINELNQPPETSDSPHTDPSTTSSFVPKDRQQNSHLLNHVGNVSNPAVVFDDELNLSLGNLSIPVTTSEPKADNFLLSRFSSSPANLTSASLQDSANDDATSTPPPAPGLTTGMPIGVDADRSAETNGWLRSLQGFVHSFGRRLVQPSDQTVNSNQGATFSVAPELQGAASGRGLETARSSRPSIFNQLLKSMIGSDEEQALVMRPLNTAYPTEIEKSVGDARIASDTSRDTNRVTTAPQQVDSELNLGSQNFARRSDESHTSELSEPLISLDSSTNSNRQIYRREDKQLGNRQSSQMKLLTCYDSILNRTYLPNEIMPTNRDDPCKTCTCVLGEQLCQTLVCPERPAEGCTEERRPGECCANYLCGNNLITQQHPLQPPQQIRTLDSFVQQADSRAKAQPTLGTNLGLREGRLPIGQLLALQRQAQHVSPSANSNLNNLNRQSNRGRQPLNYQPSIVPNNFAAAAASLPQHLRFRPNIQVNNPALLASNPSQLPQQLFNIDKSRVIFNSILQDRQNQQQTQVNSLPYYQPAQVFSNSQNLLNPANLKPPMLLHPPRNSISQPWQFQPQITPQTNNKNRQETMSPLLSRTGTSGLAPINMGPPKASSIPPQQILSSTESITPFQIHPMFEVPRKSMISAATPTVASPPELSNELVPASSDSISSPSKDRVHFPVNTVDSGGFRPIPSPVLRLPESQPAIVQLVSVTTNQPEILITTTTTTTAPALTEPLQSLSESVNVEQLNSNLAQPVPEFKAPITIDFSSSTATSNTQPQSIPEVVTAAAATTTAATLTTTEVKPETSTTQADLELDTQSSHLLTTSEVSTSATLSPQTEGTQEFDPLAMFKVSECNIYGRLYKVGQFIDELSDSCKRCTCTQMGVDCQMNCT